MQGRLLALLDNNNQLIVRKKLHHIPSNYAELQEAALQKELLNELKKLYQLIEQPDIAEDVLKSQFKLLCKQRENLNQSNYFSYTALPEGLCNQLYFDVLVQLFQPKHFFDVIAILLPSIKARLTVTLSNLLIEKNDSNKQNIEERLQISLNEASLESLSAYPAQLATFTEIVIDTKRQIIFMLDDIKDLPLHVHQRLFKLLNDDYHEIKEKLYQHNDDYKQLHFDIEFIGSQAVTLNEMLTRFAKRLIHGGTHYTNKQFADPSAITACSQFQNYLDNLPSDFNKQVMQLSGDNKKYTIQYIMEVHFGLEANCIEQAAEYIKAIQENAKNKEILNQIPYGTKEQINLVKNRYRHQSMKIIGYDNIKTLPLFYLQSLLKYIKIDSVIDYIDLLINIPPTEYKTLIEHADIQCFPTLPEELDSNIDMFSQEQKKAFFQAMVNHRHKLDVQCVLYFAARNNLKFVFVEILKEIPKEHHKNIITKIQDNSRYSLLHVVIKKKNIEFFQVIWESLSKDEQWASLCGDQYVSLIHFMAKEGSAAILKYVLASLPENEQLNILTKKMFQHQLAPIYEAIVGNNEDTFFYIYEYLISKHHAIWDNELNSQWLYRLIEKNQMAIFDKLWATLSKKEQEKFLNEKNRENISNIFLCLHEANFETCKRIYQLFAGGQSEYYSIKNNINNKFFLLSVALTKEQTDFFYIIWQDLSMDEQAIILKMQDVNNRTIFQYCLLEDNILIFKMLWNNFYKELLHQIPAKNNRLFYEVGFSNHAEIVNIILAQLSDEDIYLHLYNNNDLEDMSFMMRKHSKNAAFQAIILKLIAVFLYFNPEKTSQNLTHLITDVVRYANADIFKVIWEGLSDADQKMVSNLKFKDNYTLLHYAMENTHVDIWKIVWGSFKNQSLEFIHEYKLLYFAVKKGRYDALFDIIKCLSSNDLWTTHLRYDVNFIELLDIAIHTGSLGIFRLIWESLPWQEHGTILLAGEQNKSEQNKGDNLLTKICARQDGFDYFMIIWQSLLPEHKLAVLERKYKNNNTLFHVAMTVNNDIFYFLWECLSKDQQLELIQNKYDNSVSLLYNSVKKNRIDIFKLLWQQIPKDNAEFLFEIDGNQDTMFHHAARRSNPAFFTVLWQKVPSDFQWKILSLKNHDRYTVLHEAVKNNIIILKLVLNSLSEENRLTAVLVENIYDYSPLDLAIQNQYLSAFDIIWNSFSYENQKLLIQQRSSGICLLHVAAARSAPGTWWTIWNAYSEEEKCRLVKDKSNSLLSLTIDKNHVAFQTVLQFINQHELKQEIIMNRTYDHCTLFERILLLPARANLFFKTIWDSFSDAEKLTVINTKTRSGEDFMSFSLRFIGRDIFNYMWEFYIQKGNVENHFLYSLIATDHYQGINLYLNSFPPEKKFSIICHQLIDSNNLLHIAFKNENIVAARALIYALLPHEQWQSINLKDKFGNHLLNLAITVSSEKLTILVLNLIPEEEMLTYLKEKNNKGVSALHLAARHCNEFFWDTLMQYVKKEKYAEIMYEKTMNGNTLLHMAAENNNPSILKTMMMLLPSQHRLAAVLDKNRFGNAPLHRAAKNKNAKVFKMLLLHLNPEDREIALNGHNKQQPGHLNFLNFDQVNNEMTAKDPSKKLTKQLDSLNTGYKL